FLLGVMIGGLPGFSQTEMEIPTEHSGIGVTLLGAVGEESLQKQIGLSGYELRLREIVIEPGGVIARHSHAKRPGIVKTISGTWTEGRPGEAGAAMVVTEFPADGNNILSETWDVEHWGYNTANEPAVLMVCGLASTS
ncbi:MAG: hypothetical protein R3245_07975, partial [Kiloniellales bacterium]|nr:hypothetical protein [Kiloniellales bacterium]